MYLRIQKFLFFPVIVLKVDSSFNIKDRKLKCSMVLLGIIIYGTMSHLFFIKALVFVLGHFENDFTKFIKCFPIFVIK